jgi:hypothetical protein
VYPLEKDRAGNAAWQTMHHRASLYPDSPTDKEKERMKTFLYESMRSVALLCKNCNNHIKQYLKQHPIVPALANKKAISKYLCEFHNSVNEQTGKEIHNCHTILSDKKPCTDCEVVVKNDLKGSFEKFKQVSVAIFNSLCDRHKLPHPTIKFHECPNNPSNSCTSMWVDKRNNEIIEKPIVYLHPNVFGLRTIVHEFLHYIKQFSKDTLGGLDEYTVEKEAQAILSNEFPYDKLDSTDFKPPVATVATPIIRKDTTSALTNFPLSQKIFDKHLRNIKRRDFAIADTGGENGDLIYDMMQGVTQGRDEGFDRESREMLQRQNALSFLDGIYSPFAALFGMKSADLNLFNTPTIISNAALALMKSQLSPIGSLLLTAVSSLGIYGALAFQRHGLTYGDKMLMNSFGSNLLFSTIDYMRPDNKEEVIEGAVILGEAVSHQQWNLVPKILMGDYISSMVGETTVSPQTVTRNVQRSVAASSPGSGRSANTIRVSRNEQRAAGAYTDPDNPTMVRDVRTGAATGGAGRRFAPAPSLSQTVVENSVEIPSDEDEQYESAFGAHVSDGRTGGIYAVPDNTVGGLRRNTIKDIFENDPGYDNFNDEYIEEAYY